LKKVITLFLICLILVQTASCDIITNEKNSIGKSGNTVVTVYNALKENFVLRKKEGYSLYGVRMIVNSENVGMYTYVYTDKKPDSLKYTDILVVEVNNRTGRIEKFSAPDYETYETMPYDMIKTAMPIDPSLYAIDSDTAVKNAAKAHFGNNFNFNYIELFSYYYQGKPVYIINHISLVNDCIYRSVVDVMTGDVIDKSVEEL